MGKYKVAVIGSGLMGTGIAHTFAVRDFQVDLYGHSKNFRDKVLRYLHHEEKQKRLTKEEKHRILKNLKFYHMGQDYERLQECDLVIETVKEDKALKKEVLREIDPYMDERTIIGSNTSTFSITELASELKRPENMLGIHFVSPVPMMRMVEIVKGYRTGSDVVERVKEIVLSIDKNPYVVKDNPGFVFNRMLVPFLNESILLLDSGLVEGPEELDRMVMDGFNLKVGPLKLADLVGIDVIYHSMMSLYENFHDPKYRPSPALKRMVDAGYLGRKTGMGFYCYR